MLFSYAWEGEIWEVFQMMGKIFLVVNNNNNNDNNNGGNKGK